VRPGLLFTHGQQRLHDQKKKKQDRDEVNRTVGVRELEERGRQQGLETAIGNNNKGFSLLQKMGYKPGTGIGKNSKRRTLPVFHFILNSCFCHNADSGRVEPIGIVLKTDRKGLGRDAALKEIRELKKSMIRSRRRAEPNVCEYRERQAREAAEKLDYLDLLRCQRVCRQMDLEQVTTTSTRKNRNRLFLNLNYD